MAIYLITVPIHETKSEDIGEAFIENVITKYCIPEYIIMHQDDSAFMSSLMTYLLNKFNLKIMTVGLDPITISLFKLNMVLNLYQLS